MPKGRKERTSRATRVRAARRPATATAAIGIKLRAVSSTGMPATWANIAANLPHDGYWRKKYSTLGLIR
jgi:hypothetical protein